MNKFKQKIRDIIYEADTPAGQFFDIALIVIIILSVILVALETVVTIHDKYQGVLNVAEWLSNYFLFTIEYGLRIYSVNNPKKYIFSFYGMY